VQREHLDLLQAIASKDETQAANMARAHIESFRNTILRVL
jgi:DNA-binding GntR family transcriptional regulator